MSAENNVLARSRRILSVSSAIAVGIFLVQTVCNFPLLSHRFGHRLWGENLFQDTPVDALESMFYVGLILQPFFLFAATVAFFSWRKVRRLKSATTGGSDLGEP